MFYLSDAIFQDGSQNLEIAIMALFILSIWIFILTVSTKFFPQCYGKQQLSISM